MTFSQKELLDEGFWKQFQKPFRAVSGVIGAATKGLAKTADYLAPQITQPLHSLERAARDIGNEARLGWKKGYEGRKELYKTILADSGFIMDEDFGVKKTGKNWIAVGWRSIDDPKHPGKLMKNEREGKMSFIFDKNNQFRIQSKTASDTSSMSKYGQIGTPKKHKTMKSVAPKKQTAYKAPPSKTP